MAILFDIDETLIDHGAALRQAVATLYQTVAVEAPLEAFAQTWDEALRRWFDRYLAGEITYEEQRRARVRETIDAQLSDTDADRIFAGYLSTYEANWTLFPDVLPTLDRLAAYPLGIVSNGQTAQQRLKLERMGIARRFRAVVISEDCGYAKPRAEIFHMGCALLDEPPSRCVHVGDLYDVDAMGARQAGLTGVWLDRQGTAADVHERPVIRSLADLPAVIRLHEERRKS